MPAEVERLQEAINRHDPDTMLACFDPDYESEQPGLRRQGTGAQELVGHVRELPRPRGRGAEAEHRRTRRVDRVALERHEPADGRRDHHGNKGGPDLLARLYMEPVEQAGQDINEAMRTITGEDRQDKDSEER